MPKFAMRSNVTLSDDSSTIFVMMEGTMKIRLARISTMTIMNDKLMLLASSSPHMVPVKEAGEIGKSTGCYGIIWSPEKSLLASLIRSPALDARARACWWCVLLVCVAGV